jgi:hypothetical protein
MILLLLILIFVLMIGFLIFMWGYATGRNVTIRMAQMILDGTLPIAQHPGDWPTAEELVQRVARTAYTGSRHINLDD